jgi:hypothetical protein
VPFWPVGRVVKAINSATVPTVKEIEQEQNKHLPDKMLPYLHFDFVVKTRLQELGWGFKDYFRRPLKPAEIRAKDDFGWPLTADRITFCVWCCTQRIYWPKHPQEIYNVKPRMR